VSDAPRDRSVRVFAQELVCVCAWIRVRCAVGVAFECNRWNRNRRALGQAAFKIVISHLAFSQTEAPAVIVDDDVDMVRIVERRRGTLERGVVEVPLRRRELPNQPGKITPVLLVASPTALGRKIVLIPLKLGRRRQRRFARGLAPDEVSADGDDAFAPFRPQRRPLMPAVRAPPIESADDGLDEGVRYGRASILPEER
jgi:hypothetical protein